MFLDVEKSCLRGSVAIPGSKSHTIRAIALASLGEGESIIRQPLQSLDTEAAIRAYRAFGARMETKDPDCWQIYGLGGRPQTPNQVIDVANSGTTLYIALATAALVAEGSTVLTGDDQIRRRPADGLIGALNSLGAEVYSTRGGSLCPLVARGPLQGGTASIEAVTSQWVTAILLNAPFAVGDTTLEVPLLNEAPYVRMTLDWLEQCGLSVRYKDDFSQFYIPGRQKLDGFDRKIPADFSSATFFLVAGAALDADLEIHGLDMNDSQGDKAVVRYLEAMGARLEIRAQSKTILVRKAELHGADLDMNATPDALPAMAVAAALARGTTRLLNVPQARVKETDRITVMAAELSKMGIRIHEMPDGLEIEGCGKIHGSKELRGHGDHRIVMALSVAAMAANEPSRIDTAEAISVTFPSYCSLMEDLGAKMKTVVE